MVMGLDLTMIVVRYLICFPKEIRLYSLIFAVGRTLFKEFEVIIVGRNKLYKVVFGLLCRVVLVKVTRSRNLDSRSLRPISISEAAFTIFPLRRSKGGEISSFPESGDCWDGRRDRQADGQTDRLHAWRSRSHGGSQRSIRARRPDGVLVHSVFRNTTHTLLSTAGDSFLPQSPGCSGPLSSPSRSGASKR